jgi:hypothetical protein
LGIADASILVDHEKVAAMQSILEEGAKEGRIRRVFALHAMAALSSRMDQRRALEYSEEAQKEIARAEGRAEQVALGSAMVIFASILDDSDAAKTLEIYGTEMRSASLVPCDVVAPLVRRSTIQSVIRIINMPVCNPGSRYKLMSRISEVVGEDFKTKGSIDQWKFAEWARRNGYNLHAIPQLDRERIRF